MNAHPGSPINSNLNVLWFLPTHGDSRYLGTAIGGRQVGLRYLRQIAQAADELGYFGVLLPTGRSCEDSWIVASALAPLTERLRYLVAVRPGLQSPSVAARMTATLDRLSGGRLLINVVTGGDPAENAGDGIFLSHDERYDVTREFLDVYKELLSGGVVNTRGKHIAIEDGRLLFPPVQAGGPPLYFGGSSDAGIAAGVKTIDKYLTWGEPPDAVAEKIARVRNVAARVGRTLSFGIRLHVIVRETNEEAWKAADDLIRYPTTTRSPRRSRFLPAWIRSARDGWRRCMAAGATNSKSARTCGPASGSFAAAPVQRWSAIHRPSPRGSRNMPRSASIRSFSPAIRILRKPIALPSSCSRCCR